MLYYLGKGTEFKKEECKEYKTIEGALKAAAKDESLVVWDENGQVIGSLTDNVPEGALQENPDGTINTYDDDGNKVGTISPEEAAAITGNTGADDGQQDSDEAAGAATDDADDENSDEQGNEQHETENGQNGANTEPQNAAGDDGQQDSEEESIIIPQGTMKVTVICDGTLNLRRSPNWGNGNICGRAARGQSYFVKEIHTVDGKKMVRTVDDIYLSGASEHVQFEQL
jgi:hypothetical protein